MIRTVSRSLYIGRRVETGESPAPIMTGPWPKSDLAVAGPGGSNLYFKGLLDKLGVTANVYRVGTYKAAVEPFTRNDMSPEARENLEALVAVVWEEWKANVKKARPKANIELATAGPVPEITCNSPACIRGRR